MNAKETTRASGLEGRACVVSPLRLALRLFRLVRVGLVYFTFGATIAVATWVVVPIASRLRRSESRGDLTQWALHRAARVVRRVVGVLRVIDVRFYGIDRLLQPGPLLMVANHPTALDATFLVSMMEQVDNIAEVSWIGQPIIGRAIVEGGHLSNDDPRRVIEESARRLAAGRRVLIFPEGTRSPEAALHPFHRGAARIALASGCDMLPIVIRCTPPFGLKGRAWYDIPEGTPRMSFTVGEPISAKECVDGTESRGLAARKVNQVMREYFLRELGYADV